MSSGADAEQLQSAFIGVVRALGLLRPDTTPCGQQMSITEAHALGDLYARGPVWSPLATKMATSSRRRGS